MKKNQVKNKNYETVLLEEIRSEMKGLAEGVVNLNEKMDRGFGRVDKEIADLNKKMDSQFKQVFEYLSRIEGEILDVKKRLEKMENNSRENKKEIDELKKEIERIENKFDKYIETINKKLKVT